MKKRVLIAFFSAIFAATCAAAMQKVIQDPLISLLIFFTLFSITCYTLFSLTYMKELRNQVMKWKELFDKE